MNVRMINFDDEIVLVYGPRGASDDALLEWPATGDLWDDIDAALDSLGLVRIASVDGDQLTGDEANWVTVEVRSA
jgi:hypothetical protein